MSETKVAPETSVATTEEGGLLEQVVAAIKQTEPDRAQELVKTLVEQALQILKNLAGKRLDPEAVSALLAVYARGEIKIQRFTIKRPIIAAPAEAPAAVEAAIQLLEPRGGVAIRGNRLATESVASQNLLGTN